MAHPRAIAYKQAIALLTIETAASALAEKFGVEFAPLPNVKGDPAFARAAQLEHVGNFLQSIAVASKSAKEIDFAPPEQGTEQPTGESIPVEEVPESVVKAAKAVAPKKEKKGGRPKGK